MIWDLARMFWHELTCAGAWGGASNVTHTTAGRSYECGCGYGIFKAYSA